MSEQERREAFAKALEAATAAFGITIGIQNQSEQLNSAVVQTRASVVLLTVTDWKAPEEKK